MKFPRVMLAAFVLGCPAPPSETPRRVIVGYPPSLEADASVATCQSFEPSLPKPLSDDDALARFAGVPATRHSRRCNDRDFHPCDPVGPHDCDAPGWDKTWSSPVREGELHIAQRYWTVLDGKCRFIGEVRFAVASCGDGPRDRESNEERIEAPRVPVAVDLISGEPITTPPTTAVGSTNRWK